MSPILLALAHTASARALPPLIPAAQVVEGGEVSYPMASVRIDAPPALANEAAELKALLKRKGVKVTRTGKGRLVRLAIDPLIPMAEAYRLESLPKGIVIRGKTPAGVFYGLQTLDQLIIGTGASATVSSVDVSDWPRFSWRGVMLDVSRHFFTKAEVIKLIDQVAAYKYNVFHWHLNDDGGWRLESKAYPNLTKQGAFRVPASSVYSYPGMTFPEPGTPGAKYGGFYTRADVREIVAHAAKKHVTVVPEIDVPGHNLAAAVSYPWLICDPKLQPGFKAAEGFEFPNILCPSKETTYKFLDAIFSEVADLFPGKHVHIGGDEVDKYLWTRCPDCLRTMKEKGMKEAAELESLLISRVEQTLRKKGKTILGWDEILEGGIGKSAVVMSWRGTEGGYAAAKAGHKVVMTPFSHTYFNVGHDRLPLEKVLEFDPSPSADEAILGKNVLGSEACLWTEDVESFAEVEERLFPRSLALAEVLWKGAADRKEFESRLAGSLDKLAKTAPGFYLDPPPAPAEVLSPSSEYIHPGPLPKGAVLLVLRGSQESVSASGRVALSSSEPIKVAYRMGSKRSEWTLVPAADIRPVYPFKSDPGLTASVYQGSFSQVPKDWLMLKASEQSVVKTVGIPTSQEDNYSVRLSGFLVVQKPGRYTLTLASDDGSVLAMNGSRIIDNDGFHGVVEKSVSVSLKAGYYPLEIGYFEATEGASLKLFIEGPDLSKQEVPPSMLAN